MEGDFDSPPISGSGITNNQKCILPFGVTGATSTPVSKDETGATSTPLPKDEKGLENTIDTPASSEVKERIVETLNNQTDGKLHDNKTPKPKIDLIKKLKQPTLHSKFMDENLSDIKKPQDSCFTYNTENDLSSTPFCTAKYSLVKLNNGDDFRNIREELENINIENTQSNISLGDSFYTSALSEYFLTSNNSPCLVSSTQTTTEVQDLENDSLNGNKNCNSGIWTSVSRAFKSVVKGVPVLNNSFLNRSKRLAEEPIDEKEHCWKKMKISDVKCRPTIRPLPLLLPRCRYVFMVDKATQTD